MKKNYNTESPTTPFPLYDWGQICLICPCTKLPEKELKNIQHFEMHQNIKPSTVLYKCKNPNCPNQFDYEIKIRLFELLSVYWNDCGSFEGFQKIIQRKSDKIKLKYMGETNITPNYKMILIEVTNKSYI